ncbi:MAG: aldo/keto reductase [Pseudomonadota bacterium]
MRYVPLGSSGIAVSRLCLGSMLFNNESDIGVDRAVSLSIVDGFLEAGGNYLDTADIYGGGASEAFLADALEGRRDRLIVATKAGAAYGGDPLNPRAGLSRHAIRSAIDGSLSRLKTDYVDLWYLHGPDPLTPIDETIRGIEDALREGKIRAVGFSNLLPWQAAEFVAKGPFAVSAAQYQYSLVCRDIEEDFFAAFERENLTLHAWGPLGQGFLTGRYSRESMPEDGRVTKAGEDYEEHVSRRTTERNWGLLDALREIAAAHEVPMARIALAWILSRPVATVAVVGPRSAAQWADLAGSVDLSLSNDELGRLDKLSAMPIGYPQRVVNAYFKRELAA